MGAVTTTVTMDVRHKAQTDKYFSMSGTVAFGNGSLTYPTGGVPVTLAQLGFRNTCRGVYFCDDSSADGYVYKFDLATLTIRIYETDSASPPAPLVEMTTSYTPLATTLKFEAEGY